MVGIRTVTGEEAGTGGIDKLLGTEGPLRGTVVSCAVPEAPLLADAGGGKGDRVSGPASRPPVRPGKSLRNLNAGDLSSSAATPQPTAQGVGLCQQPTCLGQDHHPHLSQL